MPPNVTDIIFYINLAFAFCVLIELTSTVLMMRKTACMYSAGLTAVILYGIGLVSFCVQFVLYIIGHKYSQHAVFASCAISYSGFITAGVYRILLGKRSDTVLSVFAGVFAFFPPVGTVFCVILLFRMRFDTRVESIVYNGFAYTFAVLESIVVRYRAEFIDGGGEERYEELDKKSEKALLKKLKKRAVTPEGCYKYGNALINYRPDKYGAGIKMYKKAANGNYAPALFNLGYCYEKGSGVKKDEKRAHELYNRAAALGDTDAALRLGIVNMASGKKSDGIAVFNTRAEQGDICAKYNIGVCYERGDGVDPDYNKAVSIYCECIGLAVAQQRLFSLAADCIGVGDLSTETYKTERFNTVTRIKYGGALALMMRGLIAIKEKRAADAAECFLDAVKKRGMWEGIARCLVGSLYMDCGAKASDRQNGAAYVRSAFGLTPVAKELYATVPKSLINATPEKKRNMKKPITHRPPHR